MNKLSKNIVYTENGMLQFVPLPAPHIESDPKKQHLNVIPEDDEVYINRFIDDHPDVVIVEGSDIPEDVEYNLSWELSNGEIVINMAKAREVHKDFLRFWRQEAYQETDALFMQCQSMGKDPAQIQARQDYLRDITEDPTIEAATTIAELKQVVIADWTPPVISELPNI
jgi:hypothetical protein